MIDDLLDELDDDYGYSCDCCGARLLGVWQRDQYGLVKCNDCRDEEQLNNEQ